MRCSSEFGGVACQIILVSIRGLVCIIHKILLLLSVFFIYVFPFLNKGQKCTHSGRCALFVHSCPVVSIPAQLEALRLPCLGRCVCTLLEGLEAILHANKLWRVQQLLFATLWQCTAHTQDGRFFVLDFFNFVHLARTAPCVVEKIDYMNTYFFNNFMEEADTHTHTHTHTHT